MKKILALLMILGVLMVVSHVYASDQTDTLGAVVTGSAIHTMSITSGSSMSYQDPGDKGPQTYTLTGSPVTLVIADNDVAVQGEAAMLVKGQITSSLPTQYGNQDDDTYVLRFGAVTWTPDADSDVTPIIGGNAANVNSTGEFALLGSLTGWSAGNLAGQLDMDWYLIVHGDKRMYGNTSDSITITYTFIEY